MNAGLTCLEGLVRDACVLYAVTIDPSVSLALDFDNAMLVLNKGYVEKAFPKKPSHGLLLHLVSCFGDVLFEFCMPQLTG